MKEFRSLMKMIRCGRLAQISSKSFLMTKQKSSEIGFTTTCKGEIINAKEPSQWKVAVISICEVSKRKAK